MGHICEAFAIGLALIIGALAGLVADALYKRNGKHYKSLISTPEATAEEIGAEEFAEILETYLQLEKELEHDKSDL